MIRHQLKCCRSEHRVAESTGALFAVPHFCWWFVRPWGGSSIRKLSRVILACHPSPGVSRAATSGTSGHTFELNLKILEIYKKSLGLFAYSLWRYCASQRDHGIKGELSVTLAQVPWPGPVWFPPGTRGSDPRHRWKPLFDLLVSRCAFLLYLFIFLPPPHFKKQK